jgi:tripartite-type tricarboxylate transporter receptor subunit TctC
MLTRLAVALIFPGLLAAGTRDVAAQSYPVKPIRIYASDAGGTVDLLARMIGPALTSALGQSVVVENRTSILTIEAASKSAPDGYSLLVAAGTLWIGPLLQVMPYDAFRDFAPIAVATTAPNVLVVHPSLPIRSVNELIALARKRPGELNYSSGPTGSYPYLSAELFKAMTGVNIVRILYKGSGPALTALIGGEVQLTFGTPGSMTAHLKSNRLRALAVTGPQPSPLAPGLPTVSESGVPGYEAVATQGAFAPAGTPAAIVNRLHQEIARFLTRPDTREKLLNSGLEAVGGPPDQLSAVMKSEVSRLGKAIKDAGIKAN